MTIDIFIVSCILLSVLPQVHLIVPPKTPRLSGFEPAAIGSKRELVCDASQPGAGTITYKWYKYSTGHNGVENWESKGPIGTSQKYVFSPVTEKKVFHIHVGVDTQPVSGKYLCRASNSAGTRDSEWGDLYVYKPCSLYSVSVSPAKPAIGSTFTLNCYIPNPSGFAVNWMKRADALSAAPDVAVANSKGCHAPSNPRYSWSSCSPPSISTNTKTFNLQVTNAQPADFAYWICKDISLSCDSNPVRPVVQAPPGTPQITGFPSGPVTAGTQLNLKCVASPPGDTYEWYKDGTKVTTSSSYDFQVKKESAGVYRCVARNDVGSAISSEKTLVVYYKADSVVVSSGKTSSRVGEKDKFTCTVSGGSPTPTVKLYFKRSGGTPVEVTQGQDRVMSKEDNQAEYYCVVKVTGYPALDMTSSKKTYNVTFSNTGVSFLNNPTVAVQVGQVVKFTCETDESNPITNIKWYPHIGSSWRDVTTRISSSERNGVYGGKIRISEWSVTATKAMNGATTRCMATYSLTGHHFTIGADTVIYVKWSSTQLKMVEKPSTPVTAGSGVTIKCETDSNNARSPGTISWYRNGQQITTGVTPSTRQASDGGTIYISELTFTARKEDNQAKYECKINDQASFKKDVTITVHSAQNTPNFTITRNRKMVTVSFGPLIKEYTGFQLRFCGLGQTPKTTGCSASLVLIEDSAKSHYDILLTNETRDYVFYLELYDGDDVVYSSGPVHSKHSDPVDPEHGEQAMPAGDKSYGGMVAGVVVAEFILVAVVVVVVVLHRRNMACFSARNKPEGSNQDDERTGTTSQGSVFHDPVYMNVDNKAFEGDSTSHEPVYVNDPKQKHSKGKVTSDRDEPQKEKRVQVIYEDTVLTEKPRSEHAARNVEDGDENPYDEMGNAYAALNITPDVIADQTYAELKQCT